MPFLCTEGFDAGLYLEIHLPEDLIVVFGQGAHCENEHWDHQYAGNRLEGGKCHHADEADADEWFRRYAHDGCRSRRTLEDRFYVAHF